MDLSAEASRSEAEEAAAAASVQESLPLEGLDLQHPLQGILRRPDSILIQAAEKPNPVPAERETIR
jgi:hypothetical protein